MKMKGNDLILWVNGTAVASSRTCDIEVERDLIEVSSPESGAWRNYIGGRRGWKVSVAMLVTTVKGVVVKEGEDVYITIGSRDTSSDRLAGYAICTSSRLTGTRGNLCTGSWTFHGDGALT